MDKDTENKPPEISPLGLVCLTLITDRRLSGYDIAAYLQPFWKPSHQQVYRELGRLHDIGLVSCTDKPNQGKPDSKLYMMNARGERALKYYQSRELERFDPIYPRGYMVSMMMAGNLDYFRRILKNFAAREEAQQKYLKTLTEPKEVLMALRHLNQIKADIDFAQSVLYMFE